MRSTSFTSLAFAIGLLLLVASTAHGQGASECQDATVVAPVAADAWVDLNSPLANKGSDAVLDVSGDARALVRFALPEAVPEGCVVESARLRLYADSGTEGARVEAVPVASEWSETSVNWENQPGASGSGVAAWSIEGYMTWNVTAHVRELIGAGGGFGWLIRDAFDGTELAGGHGFYAREKGESPPQVVIRFAPRAGEPAPPAPPVPAEVTCGQLITHSIRVTNDLVDCLGDGLLIGAPRIVVDLDGHTIDGIGLGHGIRNEGYESVVIRNGTVREFDHGVQLLAETADGVVEDLLLHHNEVSGIMLFDARAGNEVRRNTLDSNGGGLLLLSGTNGAIVSDNTLTLNSGGALELRDAERNRLEGNRVVGDGDLGIGLERSVGNVLENNVVAGTSDGGIELLLGSHGNRIEDNIVDGAGDTGIKVKESDRNELVGNSTHGMSDSGITLEAASDGVVSGNDLGANPGGLQMDGSSRNLVSGNVAVGGTGIGIELGGGSYGNTVVRNTASGNGATGIYVGDEAGVDPLGLDPGNMIVDNTADENGADGITVAKGGHTLVGNVTRGNRAWGINAGLLTIDGGRNAASGNAQVGQCVNVLCKEDWNGPETTIDDHPPVSTRDSSATFAFSADEPGARFECRLYRDDAGEFEPCTSPARFTELATGTYTFEVRAIDRLDNVDETPAGFTWSIDATPPETEIESGPPELTAETSASFTFAADEPATFECALDDGSFAACGSPHEYAGLAGGEHALHVRATDLAGNADPTPATYRWTIDTVAPETTIDTGPPASTQSTSATFTFSATEPSALECALDDAAFAACDSPLEYRDLTDGEHTLRVRATDGAGNTDPTPASHTWTIDTTPPDTTIDDGPPSLTRNTSASFKFAANEPASFECALDDAEFAACESPLEYRDLTDGTHTLRVRATDHAGNTDPTPASYRWTIDTIPPETTIDTGPEPLTNNRSARFTFSADEPGATFECAVDDAAYAPCTSPVDYTGLADGEHTLRVRATDRAGNVDDTPAVHVWTVDTAAPETRVDSGPEERTASRDARFEFGADEGGAVFECSLDGGEYAPCDSPAEYRDLAVGAHEFRVRATDRAGNTDPTPAVHAWTIEDVPPADTTPPETVLGERPADPTNSGAARFTFTGTDDQTAAAELEFECSLDGAAFTACASPNEYAGLADGSHTFRVRARDAAGNADASPATHTWTIDTAAPETTINSGPSARTNSSAASFAFSSSEAGSTFECSLDNAAFTACVSPRQYSGLSVGTHTFRVRARDAVGNLDATPAVHTWTIDTTAPQTTINSGPPAQTTNTSAGFTFSSSETGSTFECALDSAAFTACTSPREYSGLAAGQHTFRVRARDAAGNVDATPASRTWTIESVAGCPTTTLTATADAWIDQNSPSANKGGDSVLKVQSKGARDNFRALVRFAQPRVAPGCVLSSATLRLYAGSWRTGRTLHALRLTSTWTENLVTWSNQPPTTGSPAAAASGSGYREWNVTAQIQAGADHGFLIRDAVEGADAEQQFHSREKGDSPPQLVLRYASDSS